mmetsp:Transcript_8039/g.12749  ORF Transcript_8039/g.12749 Transcript_8039/m.12749 type:complete len:86 (-) Transcript_8039:372-629(-)
MTTFELAIVPASDTPTEIQPRSPFQVNVQLTLVAFVKRRRELGDSANDQEKLPPSLRGSTPGVAGVLVGERVGAIVGGGEVVGGE